MELSQIMTALPFVLAAACSLAIYFSTRNSCDKSIGKIPGIGKVCKTKFVRWVVIGLALLCGSSGLTILRTILG